MNGMPWLTIITVLPVVGAAVALFSGRHARGVAQATGVIAFVLSLAIWLHLHGDGFQLVGEPSEIELHEEPAIKIFEFDNDGIAQFPVVDILRFRRFRPCHPPTTAPTKAPAGIVIQPIRIALHSYNTNKPVMGFNASSPAEGPDPPDNRIRAQLQQATRTRPGLRLSMGLTRVSTRYAMNQGWSVRSYLGGSN